MKSKALLFHLEFPGTDVVIAVGKSLRKATKKANKARKYSPFTIDSFSAKNSAVCVQHPDGWSSLLFTYSLTYADIVHESLHATIHILGHRGIKLCHKSEEVYTYFQDMLVTKILKWCKQEKIKVQLS